MFVDTSGLLAVLDADAAEHEEAAGIWNALGAQRIALETASYVVVEGFALVQRRSGMDAVRALHQELLPLVTMRWVDSALHTAGVQALLTAGRRRLSLVDCVSFAVMQQRAIQAVFGFDSDFSAQGFHVLTSADLADTDGTRVPGSHDTPP